MARIPKVKIKNPRIKTSGTKARIRSKFSSKKGYSIDADGLSTKQAKSLLKQQSKYELKRAKAGIMSDAAMKHHQEMAKIKADVTKKVNLMTQGTTSATALAGTALATSNTSPSSNPQIQVNGGLSDATQGRPNDTNKPSNGSSSSKPSNGKDWAEIIESLG